MGNPARKAIRAPVAARARPALRGLAGSYPNPTLRPPIEVVIGEQQFLGGVAIDCYTNYDLFCGYSPDFYWTQGFGVYQFHLIPFSYLVEPNGLIQFQGIVRLQTWCYSQWAFCERVFTLPPGRRPATFHYFVVPSVRGAADREPQVVVGVWPNGLVEIRDAISTTPASGEREYDLSTVRFHIAR